MLSSHSTMAASIEERLRDPNASSTTAPSVASTTSSSSTSSVHPTNIRELLWEERAKSLRDLLSNYRLPLAVKLKSGDISYFLTPGSQTHGDSTHENGLSHSGIRSSPTKLSSGVDPGLNSMGATDTSIKTKGARDEEVVLQIHETRRKKIILARKMTWEKRQNDYVVTGEQVEIPASFKGWLEVVPDDGRPVEYFDTVGGITSVKPKRFLVRTSTVGYQLTAEDNGNSCWMPTEIKPGEVLTTGIVYMDNKRGSGGGRSATQRNIFKRLLKQSKPKKEQELKYLQCFDATGQEIMIPLIMSGVFSPVGDASMANYDAVYELQDLIMAFGLPVNAQLIHVNGREKFSCPRGVIRLYGTREEELVVVSRVGPDGALTYKSRSQSDSDAPPPSPGSANGESGERFEIPIDKEALFRRGVVKKKPAIKANLVDVFKSLPLEGGGEAIGKGRGYLRTQSYDEFRLRGANEKKLSMPLAAKTKPVVSSYNNKLLNSGKDDRTESLSKDKQKPHVVYGSASQPSSPLKMSSVDKPSSVITTIEKKPEQPVSKEVELPEKVPKELKKSKSTGLLDKLSVRRAKKERAKLKELKGDDVFSRRISKSDVNYQEFFNGLNDDEDGGSSKSKDGNKEADSESTQTSGQSSGSQKINPNKIYGNAQEGNFATTSGDSSVGDNKSLTLAQKRHSNMQNRDLPPIPPESPIHEPAASPNHHINISKESLYEHLPPAPPTPASRRSYLNNNSNSNNNNNNHTNTNYKGSTYHQNQNHRHFEDDEDDGYMTPMQFRQEPAIPYGASPPVQMRGKPGPSLHDSLRASRSRRVRSELPQEFIHRHKTYDDDCPLDIDDLFSFAYGSKTLGDPRPLHTLGNHSAVSTSQLYGAAKVPAWRSDIPPSLDHRFMDNLDLENHGGHSRSRQAVRSMNANPNATIRSHNLRKSRASAMEVFHFTDSFRDIREPPEQNIEPPVPDFQNKHPQSLYDHQTFYPPTSTSRPPFLNSRSMDASASPSPSYYLHHQQQQDIYGHPYGAGVAHYAESEPCYRPNHKATSLGGTSENFHRHHGDDSMCSRGDGGFPNESEYSYNEYIEQVRDDDGWTPPDAVEGMSVLEVSKSLRYIGMKDRVVLRFSNEQIDGSMLCTLDKKHLKEGFPELNALELKKIIDFVQGWRPKKK